MPVVKLSQDFINHHLKCPDSKMKVEWCDRDLPGLFVEVRASSQGHGTFYYRYKDINGKTCTQKVGRSYDVDLSEARSKARALRAQITLGANPRANDKAEKSVITFDNFFNDHYMPYVKPRKRSWDRDEELYRLRIKAVFGNHRLNQISRLQIQTFHSSLLDEKLAPATANHHAKLIRHMLNLAVEWNMLEKNPASRIHMFEEDNKEERYMNDKQLGNLMEVLKTHSSRSVCHITTFLLATGCRLNEALSATWTQVDKEKRVFRVAAKNSKSKRMRPVPLNDTALEVLNQLKTEGIYEHLFINKKTKKPYVNISKIWDKIRIEAGLPNLRIHDLRHQAASNLINSGSSLGNPPIINCN